MTILLCGDFYIYIYIHLLCSSITFIYVLLTPALKSILIESPTGVELLKERYFVHAGEDMSLSCIATSRPGVNITWSYPAWISVKKVTRNETINRYLTKVNSTVAFKMTSSLHKRNISCHLSYRHDNLVQNSSTYLHVLGE